MGIGPQSNDQRSLFDFTHPFVPALSPLVEGRMASVFERNGTWFLRVKNHTGAWVKFKTDARTKTEAKALAQEKALQVERQSLGLEPKRPADGGGTVAELIDWWLRTYVKGTPSFRRVDSQMRFHLNLPTAKQPNRRGCDFGNIRLVDLKTGAIENFLQAKAESLAPASINHLRVNLNTALNRARGAGRFVPLANPVKEVRRRKIPKGIPDYLRVEEVPAVLAALPARWVPLFACAVYSGLRKGELLGLRKRDVDLPNRLLTVARSHARDTTKGGSGEVIPIAAELVPYLKQALESPGLLVFPAADGKMQREDTPLENTLRRALAVAGIVVGYVHGCRKWHCGHKVEAPDKEPRSCPKHPERHLWPKPKVRKIRFHDLRHTTGSLLTMAGANPAAVQAILRHKDPRTTQIYRHLAPGYLRSEIDRLSFEKP